MGAREQKAVTIGQAAQMERSMCQGRHRPQWWKKRTQEKQLQGKTKRRAKTNKSVTNTKARQAWGETIQRGWPASVESGQREEQKALEWRWRQEHWRNINLLGRVTHLPSCCAYWLQQAESI